MDPAKYNFKIWKGVTKRLTLRWRDAEGTLVPLTGYTAKMQVRNRAGGNVLIELSTANGRIALTSPGIIELYIPANSSNDILQTSGPYDLKVYPPGGDELMIIIGTVTFVTTVTED